MKGRKEKDKAVETLRGLAILFVVMGHIIGSGPDGGMKVGDESEWRHFYHFIDYLQMPLFTLVAGWVYSLQPPSSGQYTSFLTKKVRRILFPMVFVSTAYCLLQYIVPGTNKKVELEHIWKIYLFPYTLYWYLPSLFLVLGAVGALDILAGIKRFRPWLFWTIVAFGGALLRDAVIPESSPNYFSYKGALYLFPFFCIGVGLQRFPVWFRQGWMVCSSALVFFAGLIIQQLGWYGLLDFDMDRVSAVGIFAGAAGSVWLFLQRWQSNALIYLGGYSYAIYLFHSFGTSGLRIVFWRIGIFNEGVIFLLSIVAGLLVPVVAEKILNRNGWTRLLFLGRSYIRR